MSAARTCITGKKCLHTINQARMHARSQAIGMNRDGKIAETSYVYRCPECCTMHVTRRAVWNGQPNTLVHEAAPLELQRWAMGEQVG